MGPVPNGGRLPQNISSVNENSAAVPKSAIRTCSPQLRCKCLHGGLDIPVFLVFETVFALAEHDDLWPKSTRQARPVSKLARRNEQRSYVRSGMVRFGTAVDDARTGKVVQMILVVQVFPVDRLSSALGYAQEERTAYETDQMILLHVRVPVSRS
jgi:hypothetical protein